MTTVDVMIKGDLGALGEDSRRDLVGLDDALRTTNMYRDDRPGAEARRDALADERRRELVMMPLTLSHVFAHRVGRAAAGAAALACMLVLQLMLADPAALSRFRLIAWLVPRVDLDMIVALTGLAMVSVYVIATWLAEAWFARQMRAAIKTGDDPYRDLDALARGPVEIAQKAVRGIDGVSFALFLAGTSALALSFGYVLVISSALHEYPYAFTGGGIMHTEALGRNVGVLMLALLGVGVFAAWLGRACYRRDAGVVRVVGHWATLVITVVAAFATAYAYGQVLYTLDIRHTVPTTDARFLLGIGATIAIVGSAAWTLLWWRRREQVRIGE